VPATHRRGRGTSEQRDRVRGPQTATTCSLRQFRSQTGHQCECRWQYFTLYSRHKLVRFDANDNAEHNGLALGWIWVASDDTWHISPRANYEVFLPGWMWDDVEPEDVDALKDEIRESLARGRERRGNPPLPCEPAQAGTIVSSTNTTMCRTFK
jgi:hypothetical protein